jgi:hypothetical protein
MTTSFSRGLGIVSFPGALAVPIIRFFCRDSTPPSSIRLHPKVYFFGNSFATASHLRFRAMPRNYREAKKSWQTKGALQCCNDSVRLLSQATTVEWDRPKVRPPFIVRGPPIISRLPHELTLLPRHTNLSTVTFLRAIHVFLPASAQCGTPLGVPKPIFAL